MAQMQTQEGMESLEADLHRVKLSIYQVFTGSWFLVYPNFFKMHTSNNTFKHTQPHTLPKAVSVQQLQLQKKNKKQKQKKPPQQP